MDLVGWNAPIGAAADALASVSESPTLP